jgi:hypothetical protein
MRKVLATLVFLAALAPSAASAGFTLGGRLGVAFPGGEIGGGDKLADFVDWAVPLQLDLGGRGEHFELGGYLRLAPGKLDASIQDGCDASGASCSSSDLGVGAQVNYHFAAAPAGPWVGGFAGWEMLRYDADLGGNKMSLSATGWELGAQGGIDFAWGGFVLGPYAVLGFGQFGKATAEVNGSSDTQDITDKGMHRWFQLGARAGFVF